MGTIKPTTAGNYFIWFAHQHGDTITNLKLQKLVYYAQAWHLAIHDEPLMSAKFEAWVHGPVQPALYRSVKSMCDQGWIPIPLAIDRKPRVVEDKEKHLMEVYKVYGGFSAYDLERMTHQEMPWIKARKGLPPDAPSNNVIAESDMKQYYRQRLEQAQAKA